MSNFLKIFDIFKTLKAILFYSSFKLEFIKIKFYLRFCTFNTSRMNNIFEKITHTAHGTVRI